MNYQSTLDDYVKFCERRGRSQVTIESYKLIVRLWYEHLEKIGVTEPGIAEAEEFLDRPDLAWSTRACYQGWLAAFCKWAAAEGVYESDPCAKLLPAYRPYVEPRIISEHELDRVLQTEDKTLRLWLLLGAKAGLRRKEIAGIQVEDLRLDATPPVLVITNPKGRKQRTVPVNDELRAAFEAFGIPDRGYLFVGKRGHVGPPCVGRRISEHLRSKGIDLTAHSLRHRFGTQAYQKSKDLRLVQELLGHASSQTTERYTHIDQSAAAQVVALI